MIIETPSRLHMTLIDLNGTIGRIDGGVGLTIKKPKLILEAKPQDEGIDIFFKESHKLNEKIMMDYRRKIGDTVKKITDFLKIDSGFKFEVKTAYPAHSGLGSGTQLSLAVAKLILNLNDHDMDAWQIARIVGRGGTSGIGVRAFDHGGFIIDGGHKVDEKPDFLPSSASNAHPAPLIARYDFPEDWKVILAIPNVPAGASGQNEVNIFQQHCPIKLDEVQTLSHLILMKMMPSVVEKDLDSFGSAVNEIQDIGFKKIEVGFQDSIISRITQNMRDAGAAGVGMSSFGPTIYAVTDTNTKNISKVAQSTMNEIGGKVIVTEAKNNGAMLKKEF
ncbi:beta-ribofuranosylaminobenzene 5'-phosphate synthase [Methanobacterium sp.]|uniref:beta-ribofuranosylaminobenzene 5'-phosphate synthase n=1 Tax=Methanobacterium sp. TaxID=2164 RepID=UPI003C7614A0